MDYIFLFIAAILNAGTSMFCKLYQDRYIDKNASLFFRTFTVTVFGIIILLFFVMFKPEYTFKAFMIAMAFGLINTINCTFTVMAVKYGEVSIAQAFSMIGGIVFPYIFGILVLKESPSVCCIIGIVLLLSGLVSFSIDKGTEKTKNAKMFLLCVISSFILSGTMSVLQKIAMIGDEAVDSSSFNLYQYIGCLISSLIFALYFKMKNKDELLIKATTKKDVIKALLISFVATFISLIAFNLQLNGAANIDATILFPIINGGTIFITTIFSLIFFKEKISIKKWISLIVIIIGTFLFMF